MTSLFLGLSYATLAPPPSTFLPVYAPRPSASSDFTGDQPVPTIIGGGSLNTRQTSYLYGPQTVALDLSSYLSDSDDKEPVLTIFQCDEQSSSNPAQAGVSAVRRSAMVPRIEVEPGQTLLEALIAGGMPRCPPGEKYVIFVNSEKDRAALEEANNGEAGISIHLEDNMNMSAPGFGQPGPEDYPAAKPSGNFRFTPVTISLVVVGVFVTAYVVSWAALFTAECIGGPRAQSSAASDLEAGSNPDDADVNHPLPPSIHSVEPSSTPGSFNDTSPPGAAEGMS